MASTYSSSQSNTNSHTESHQTGGSHTQGGSSTTGGSHSQGGSSSQGGSHTNSTTGSYGESRSKGGTTSKGGSTGLTSAVGQVNEATQKAYDNVMNQYTQSPQVAMAYAQLQQSLNNKPGAFSSKYTQTLDNLYGQIMNRPGFSYNMNNDAVYNAYKDMYQQQGKSAMRDTVAQSAALTGGYNNSYATTAGNQAYQSYLERLNEMVPQLQQNAYNMYQDETNQLYNKANLTQSLYQQDYGQYRDQVSDWQKDRDFLSSYYNNERNFDYTNYNNNRNFTASEYWNQRNADKSTTSDNWNDASNWNNNYNYQNSKTSSDTSNWNNTNNWSDTNNWSNTNSWSDTNNWSDTVSDTNSSTSQTSSGYSEGSGGSGGSSGSSRDNKNVDTTRSVTLDGQKTADLDKMARESGINYEEAIKNALNDGYISVGDYLYMTGDDNYKTRSDREYDGKHSNWGRIY